PSMEHAVDLIDRGWSVLIYPEGTRSLSGEMQPFKPGVGLLAVELGVPVVPIHLRGLYAILAKGSSVPRRGPVNVTIGAPLGFPPGMDHVEATQRVESEIRRLSAL
ncbi:MAG: lysophospholipid acyltransferase family protein, partial [Anaerolineae bacterium]